MLLNVTGLEVKVGASSSPKKLLHDISFSCDEGEIFVVIGESGSGKTTLTRALTNLFPREGNIAVSGKAEFAGKNLLSLTQEELRPLRASQIRYIFQEPAQAFNPALRIQTQFAFIKDSREEFRNNSENNWQDIVAQSLLKMGLDEPLRVLRSYPHQLSVGMLQRIMIAMALIGSPKLIIADEPTSAIDAELRVQILELLVSSCRTHKASLLITMHDIHLAKMYADSLMVLYAGRIVEHARSEKFFTSPLHPYSQLLLESVPTTGSSLDDIDIPQGITLSNAEADQGCTFQSRCPRVQEDCKPEEPLLLQADQNHLVRCLHWK